MAKLEELVNVFVMSGAHKMFEALKTGKRSSKELVGSYRVCKTICQVQNIAGTINKLNGVRVVAHGNPLNDDCLWEMKMTSSASPLVKAATMAAPAGGWTSAPAAPTFTPAPASKMGDYIPVPDFAWMQDACEMGGNLFFHGPTGSGKTVTAQALSKAIKATFIRQNFDGETVVDNMIGATIVTVEDGVSITEFKDGE